MLAAAVASALTAEELFACRSRTIIMVDDSCPIRVERGSPPSPSLVSPFTLEILGRGEAKGRPFSFVLCAFHGICRKLKANSIVRGLFICGFVINLANIIGLSLSLSSQC